MVYFSANGWPSDYYETVIGTDNKPWFIDTFDYKQNLQNFPQVFTRRLIVQSYLEIY